METPQTLAPEWREALKAEAIAVYRQTAKEARRDILNFKDWYTFKEVSKLLNVSAGTLNKWIGYGLPYSKIDAKKYISRTELYKFLERHKVNQ
ncbi:MAG: helix-turn-helix domain-containing protein [Aerococcus sp.]|nr:helix-turn-helix domain-containing protein [Aerococcus sp.]